MTPNTGNRKRETSRLFWLALAWLCLVFVFPGPARGAGAKTPLKAKPVVGSNGPVEKSAPAEPEPGEPASLERVQLGTMPDYSRLLFSFNQGPPPYSVRRVDVDEVWIDFGSARARNLGRQKLKDNLVEGVALSLDQDRLQVRIKVASPRFAFRHFTSPESMAVVLDLRGTESEPLAGPPVTLEMPSPEPYARMVRSALPRQPRPNTPEELLAQAADKILTGDFKGAIAPLEKIRSQHAQSGYDEPATFLLGDAYFYADPADLSANFNKLGDLYQQAITQYPNSPEMPKVKFMRALAFEKMGFLGEAAGHYKLLIQDHPQTALALLGQIHLGETYGALGKRDLAKATLEEVLAQKPGGDLALKAFFQLGHTYFQEGQYSKANEVFKAILNMDDRFYLKEPSILYEMGEGYYHLDRPDLTRAYLYHALNLDPAGPNNDLVLARIGDTYRDQHQDEEAMGAYALVRRMYPGTPGAQISHIRLAEYGALRRLFRPQMLFSQMEDGTDAAIIKIYKDIIESKQDSPLVELAMFKVGQAHFRLKDYKQAMNTYQDILTRFPKGALAGDVRQALGQALLAQAEDLVAQRRYADLMTLYSENLALINKNNLGSTMKNLLNQGLMAEAQDLMSKGKYTELIALYQANQHFLNEESRPRMRTLLAQAYTSLGIPSEAAKMWEANRDSKEDEPQRLLGLGQSYLRMDRFPDAARTLAEFRQKYPGRPEALPALVDQAQAEMGMAQDESALNHLEEAVRTDRSLTKDRRVLSMLDQLYAKKGDTEGSIAAMKLSIDVLKDQPAAKDEVFALYTRLAKTYAERNQPQETEEALDAAMQARPAKPSSETLYLIAGAYKNLGKTDKYTSTLTLLQQTGSPFWRNMAAQELKPMTLDPKVDQLLQGTPAGQPKAPAGQPTAKAAAAAGR